MRMSLQFRWLGVAGIELAAGAEVLAIDPFFTRPPFWRMWFGRALPDRVLVAAKIQRCDYVLVTHAHWDHVMDVPDIVRNTGATAFGSRNTCQLLAACGVSEARIRQVEAGERVSLGCFEILVLPGEHVRIPGFSPGPLPADLRPPLRLRDYRMDGCFSYQITVQGLCVLNWHSVRTEPAVPADVLFVGPEGEQAYYQALLDAVGPQLVIPVHWDSFFRPLSQPVRPFLKPPRLALPPIQRMDPWAFAETVAQVAPGTRTLVPEMFRAYELKV